MLATNFDNLIELGFQRLDMPALSEIESVRPDVLVKGDDYRIDQIVGREQVEGWGGRVAIVPRIPEHSTSQLVERIRNG